MQFKMTQFGDRLPSGSLAPQVPGGLLYAKEVEKPVANEQEKTEKIAELVKEIVQRNNAEHNHAQRATHVRQIISNGTLLMLTVSWYR